MKQGSTIHDLAAEITRIASSKHDVIQDTRQFEVIPSDDGLRLHIDEPTGVEAYGFRPLAHQQIGDRVKIPRRYYERMLADAPDLLATNVNHWFNHQPERRLVRTLDGNARAFLSDRFLRLDNYDVAQRLLPIIQEAGATVSSCALTDSKMYLKATLPGLQTELKVGSTVQAGVLIENSEVGLGSLVVVPFTVVLQCLNGMKHTNYGASRRHVGKRIEDNDDSRALFTAETLQADDHAYWLKARDVVKAALTELTFNQIVADMRQAADSTPMTNPLKGCEVLANQIGLDSETEIGGILGHLVQGGDLTAWGAANAITRYSQDVPSYDRATELEALGNEVLGLVESGAWDRVAAAV